MVVAADDASRGPAQAFAQNLTANVIPDAPLGDVSGLGDDEIAQRASRYDLDTIIIVRALPATNGTRTLLSRLDTSTQTWTLQQRQTVVDVTPTFELACSSTHSAISAAYQAQQVEAISLRRGTYQNNRIITGAGAFEFQRGVLGDPLPESDFYLTVGRPDLRDALDSAQATKTAVLVTSGALTALGVGMTFVGWLGGGASGDTPQLGIGIAGIAGVALGTAGLIWGATMQTHPVTRGEAQEMADRFNKDLADRMNLDSPSN